MTWDNWTKKGWHIDHIIPQSMFDPLNEDHMRFCWDRRNLRPCWAFENHSKNDKIIPELFNEWHYEVCDKCGIDYSL